MNTVTDSLLNKEVGRKERGISIQYETNFVDNHARSENRGRNRWCNTSRGRSKSHPKLVSYYCGKPSHRISDCRYYKRNHKVGKVKID